MIYKSILTPEIKSVKDGIIHGTGIVFGTPETKDYDGEFFDAETETGLVDGANRPFIIEHGFSRTFGANKVADAIYEKSETGWLYEATFLKTPLGEKAYQDVITKPYRSSAGAAGHTRRASQVKGAMKLDIWMVAEQSGTITPADPNNPRLTLTKSDYLQFAVQEMLDDHFEKVKGLVTGLVSGEDIKTFLESIKGTEEARVKLADALREIKEGLSSGAKYVPNDELLASIEQVSQPIPLR